MFTSTEERSHIIIKKSAFPFFEASPTMVDDLCVEQTNNMWTNWIEKPFSSWNDEQPIETLKFAYISSSTFYRDSNDWSSCRMTLCRKHGKCILLPYKWIVCIVIPQLKERSKNMASMLLTKVNSIPSTSIKMNLPIRTNGRFFSSSLFSFLNAVSGAAN